MLRDRYAERSPDGPDHFGRRHREIACDVGQRADPHHRRPAQDLGAGARHGRLTTTCFTLAHTTSLYEALPLGQLAVIPGASHGVVFEKPDLVVRLIGDFLSAPGKPETRNAGAAPRPEVAWPATSATTASPQPAHCSRGSFGGPEFTSTRSARAFYLQAIAEIDLERPDDMRAASRTALVSRQSDLAPFELTFDLFWSLLRGGSFSSPGPASAAPNPEPAMIEVPLARCRAGYTARPAAPCA